MEPVHAIVLGIIQGITEFLPISSSGHLIFVPKLFGWADQGLAFDVVVHLGTLLAVVIYFRRKIWRLARSFVTPRQLPLTRSKGSEMASTKADKRLALFVILSIIPAGAIGLLLGDMLEGFSRNATLVAISLIFWAVVLAAADGAAKGFKDAKADVTLDKMTWKSWFIISCAQALALVPGTSRSGITMTAGMFSRFDKKSAAEFSFLMSIPVIGAAGALKIFDLFQSGSAVAYDIFALGFASSALSGLVAIWGLMKVIEKWSFMPFVIYRVIVGLAILTYL